MSVIPNAVGRIDAITEAIRDGDRERAWDLLFYESMRLMQKCGRILAEFESARIAKKDVMNCLNKIKADDEYWHKARKACGWSGVPGFEGPVEKLPPVKPALRAEELPIGTVMVLAGKPRKYETNRVWGCGDQPRQIAVMCFYNQGTCLELNPREVQELIDRGVEFRLPKGGDA
jgi:hypothetical protein